MEAAWQVRDGPAAPAEVGRGVLAAVQPGRTRHARAGRAQISKAAGKTCTFPYMS